MLAERSRKGCECFFHTALSHQRVRVCEAVPQTCHLLSTATLFPERRGAAVLPSIFPTSESLLWSSSLLFFIILTISFIPQHKLKMCFQFHLLSLHLSASVFMSHTAVALLFISLLSSTVTLLVFCPTCLSSSSLDLRRWLLVCPKSLIIFRVPSCLKMPLSCSFSLFIPSILSPMSYRFFPFSHSSFRMMLVTYFP